MKRVLNSGTIKLPQIKGSEKEDDLEFTFEIKAPLLTFLAFQDSNLGTLNRLDELDHPIAYLPPQFYKKEDLTYNIMDSKLCNVYNTKLYNFYSAAVNFYNNLLKDGMCKEQARLVLPQGMLINFLWKVTAKDLIKFVEDNYSKSPEIYGYCSILVIYLEEHLPKLTSWLKSNTWKNLSL